MTEPITVTQAPAPGNARITSRRRLSAIWIIPLLALLVGLAMLVHAWLSTGPEITVSFQSATGLEAGKTPVKYKDVVVGLVKAIDLSPDQSKVLVTIDLNNNAKNFTHADSRYWVVRPRIGTGGITGVDTLFSGAYIGVDIGRTNTTQNLFTGLETPPSVINGTPGKVFELHAADLGSLDIGSPVYYRHIQVGQLTSYHLDTDGRGVIVDIFVHAPYNRLVTGASHFWNASGLDLSLNAEGFKLQTQSIATLMAGGVAFDSAENADAQQPAAAHYELAQDRQTAMAPPDGEPQYFRLKFDNALRGLAPNAPVEFRGINIGKVLAVHIDSSPDLQHFPVLVDIQVFPRRMGGNAASTADHPGENLQEARHFLRVMVAHGLRAQARSGNLLTGQLFIAIDFFPDAPKAEFDMRANPMTLPTTGGGLDQAQDQITHIIGKLNQIPFDSIGRHLEVSLTELSQTMHQVNHDVLPEARGALHQTQQTLDNANSVLQPDSPLQQQLNQTLLEVQRSARSLRGLTDQLNAHPESLISGRAHDTSPEGAK